MQNKYTIKALLNEQKVFPIKAKNCVTENYIIEYSPQIMNRVKCRLQ